MGFWMSHQTDGWWWMILSSPWEVWDKLVHQWETNKGNHKQLSLTFRRVTPKFHMKLQVDSSPSIFLLSFPRFRDKPELIISLPQAAHQSHRFKCQVSSQLANPSSQTASHGNIQHTYWLTDAWLQHFSHENQLRNCLHSDTCTHTRLGITGEHLSVSGKWEHRDTGTGSFPRSEGASGIKDGRQTGRDGWGAWKDGKGERASEEEKLSNCERLQSFLTLSSIPADSMSRPTLQQGQSHAIFQAYSALPWPCTRRSSSSFQGCVVPGLRKVYFNRHAPQEEELGKETVIVTMSEEYACHSGDRTYGGDMLSNTGQVCVHSIFIFSIMPAAWQCRRTNTHTCAHSAQQLLIEFWWNLV